MVADVLNMAGGGEGAAGHSGTSRTLLHQVNILSFSPKKVELANLKLSELRKYGKLIANLK